MNIDAPPQVDEPRDVPDADAPSHTDAPAALTMPASASASLPAQRYQLDYRKVTLAEYWQANPRGVVGHALRKLLRLRPDACSTDDPCVHSLASFEVPRAAIPGAIAQRFSIAMSQLAAIGFREPVWHAIEDDLHRTTTYLATMTHESGRMWARVHNRIWHIRTPATSVLFCEMVSELAGDRFVWSLTTKPDLAAPPQCAVVRVPGATPNQLLAAHQSALADSGAGKPLPIHSTADVRESAERLQAAVCDFHVSRGVFATVSDSERERSVQFRDQVQSASRVGSRYPDILAEIVTLQNRKASRSSGLLLLAASIVLFFGAGLTKMGSMHFSADFLVILMGVLLFHESGHWLAMRVFGYRNLKMFFIPFFGAAVTGRHYNVAGWKKVVVSLMGPVPGIVVGSAIGAVAVSLRSALLMKVALVAILVNGFNLLPLLPLDGGWVVHAILFSRHHLLELAFRIVALCALFVLAVYSSDNVLVAVAVAMSVSLPAMYKVAKITSDLRTSSLALTSDDGQTLPPAAAEVIVDRIKSAFPAKLTNRAAAQYTLQVFENINARPPRALASIGLGLLHLGGIMGAVVASILIYAGMAVGAWHPLSASAIRVVQPQSDSALAEPRNTVFAIYGKPSRLNAAIGGLKSGSSPQTAIASFGSMAVLSLPVEDVDGLRDVQTMLEKRGTDFVISSPASPAIFRFSCKTTSNGSASAIDRELGDYFAAGASSLLPPWHPSSWTPEERARYSKARHTLRQLERSDRQLTRAGSRATPVFRDADTAVIAAYERLAGVTAASRDSLFDATVAPLLGTVVLTEGRPSAHALNLSASGVLLSDKRNITLPTLRFENQFQGPPALARWLLANGCADVRYAVASGMETSRSSGAGRRARMSSPSESH